MPSDKQIIKSMRDAFNMTKQRCYNPKNRDYRYYGGRGIAICDSWLASFDNFLADMGVRPEGYTLERRDNDGDYSPGNCIWAPRSTQGNNTRLTHKITYQGQTHSIAEWERIMGWKSGVLKARLRRLGYSIEEAFTKPIKYGVMRDGYAQPERDWSNLPRGQNNHRTRFSVSEAEAVRARWSEGASIIRLSLDFKAAIPTIRQVLRREGAYKE